MKVYIQTDIEGVAGFCFFENRKDQSQWNVLHRQRMNRLLTNEVNAAVVAAFDSGASEVYVNDSHGSGYNIIFEDLDPRCLIVHGANGTGGWFLPKFDSSFDAMILIGMHAMGGTKFAITPHSLWDVNDGKLFLSEGAMAAAIAGDFNVPVIVVSGDDKICAEFAEKVPDTIRVETKEALAPHRACSKIPARSCQEIANAVKTGMANIANIKPYKIPGPIKLVLWDSPKHIPPFEQTGEPVYADTIQEAQYQFGKKMPWNNYDADVPYGFEYP